VKTFGDLVLEEFADDPRYRYRLRVVATDLTNGRLVVFPQDGRRYGVEPDSLPVAHAVRISISIPFFFSPVYFPPPANAQEKKNAAVMVDGGVLSNFPVWLFDSDGIPEWPTFGFKIVEPSEGKPRRVT